ncbi:MAG TPA: hypothetical protein PL023_08025 [Thiobacillus sp.]|nr:hypothetical protein [Thiobacillus sp.]
MIDIDPKPCAAIRPIRYADAGTCFQPHLFRINNVVDKARVHGLKKSLPINGAKFFGDEFVVLAQKNDDIMAEQTSLVLPAHA